MNHDQSQKISVLIITLNEEINLRELLPDLTFADEVIVVDSYSTDGTKAISESFDNVKFIENTFENYTLQRNFAIDQAKNEWILFLDADERIPVKLKEEIIQTINNPNTNVAYFLYRKFMFMKKPLHFSGWQTDKNVRLFKRGTAKYTNSKLVHEKLIINGTVGKLKNKLIHYSYSDYDSYKQKMVYYGKLKARELFIKGIEPNAFHFIIKPVYKFLHSYILRLGILDGKKGLIICYLNALSVYVRYPELKKLYKSSK